MKSFGKTSQLFSAILLLSTLAFATVSSAGITPEFAYVVDPGNGRVLVYSVDSSTGALTAISGSPFMLGMNGQPFSVAVDPSGRFAYVTDFQNNGVWAYSIDGVTGALTAIGGSPVPTGTFPKSVTVDPSGKFVYVTNLYSNNVSGYTINSSTGALTEISGSPFTAGAVLSRSRWTHRPNLPT